MSRPSGLRPMLTSRSSGACATSRLNQATVSSYGGVRSRPSCSAGVAQGSEAERTSERLLPFHGTSGGRIASAPAFGSADRAEVAARPRARASVGNTAIVLMTPPFSQESPAPLRPMTYRALLGHGPDRGAAAGERARGVLRGCELHRLRHVPHRGSR